jgi:uncharacterized protein (TIGR03546 family)
MILRSIGKALLGKATPFQIRASAVLGGALGFVADLQRAPALTIGLVVILLALNTNLWLATVAALGGAALNVLLLPVSFHLGRVLLDGPTQGLFAALINAPLTALCGFEYYAITGGLVLGLVYGAVLGALLSRLVRRTREAFLKLDAGSERFRTLAAKRRVRAASWLLLGVTPSREAYEKLASKRVGNPVRVWGVGLGVAIVVAVVLLANFLAGPFLAEKLRAGLERVNGATVDLKGAKIDLAEGSVSLDGLAMADANDLATDLFRTVKVEANLSGADLLRRRVRFDRIVVDLAASGIKRDTPGERTDTTPAPQEAPPWDIPPDEAYRTLSDYVKDAQQWRDRLAQLRAWLEKFAGSKEPKKEKLDEKLRRQVREQGYAWTAAEHLIRGAPTVLISELRIERLQALQLGGKQLNIVGTNLSTQPSLSPGPPHLVVKSEDGSILFEVGSEETGRALSLALKGLSGDAVGKALQASPVSGGTVDLSVKGGWEGAGTGGVDLKLDATLLGTTLAIPGVKERKKIDKLVLPLAVKGTLDDPRVLFRNEDLTKALVAAGQKELASKLADEAGKRLGEDAKKALEGFLGGK